MLHDEADKCLWFISNNEITTTKSMLNIHDECLIFWRSIAKQISLHIIDNISYGCEEDIEDLKRWIAEEGEDALVALYYAQHDGAYVFHDFDIYVEGMDFTYENYLITTLKKALAVLELQDEMFDNVTN